jgi:MFS family permease
MAAMQRLSLKTGQFIGFGLLSMLSGALFVARFETFAALAVGMGFLGIGVGMCVPAIAAGASLAVTAEEQGAIAGMVSSAPAIGFSVGPICAGALYQVHGPMAALFSAAVFLMVLTTLVVLERKD